MASIHPFELYKLYLSIKTHFVKPNFIFGYNTLSNIRYGNFYNTKNHIRFEKLSKKWSKELAEEMFVSNFIINPNAHIHEIDNPFSIEIRQEWLDRLYKIDTIFLKNFKRFMKKSKIKTFDVLKTKMMNPPRMTKKSVNNIADISKVKIDIVDEFYSNFINILSPESAVILNELYNKKYSYNFLRKCYENNMEPSTTYLKLYKYSHFIDVDTAMSKYKIIFQLYDEI